MNKTRFVAPLLCLISACGFAGTMGETEVFYNNVITLSGGPSWTSNEQSQVVNLEPDLLKAYRANDSDSTLGSVELFLGLQRQFNPSVIYQFGLALAASSNAKLEGSIWDDADPLFDNFFYNYKVNHTHVAAKGKLLAANPFFWVQPYISGSLGVGFNRSQDYHARAKIFEQLVFPGFNAHSKTSFTYTAGAGLQKAISPHWSAGLGYEFADWGKSNLSRSIAQNTGSGLKLNHLYTHQLQFSISYNV